MGHFESSTTGRPPVEGDKMGHFSRLGWAPKGWDTVKEGGELYVCVTTLYTVNLLV